MKITNYDPRLIDTALARNPHVVVNAILSKSAIPVSAKFVHSKNFDECLMLLGKISASKLFSDRFLKLLNRFLLSGLEIEGIDGPAMRASVRLGIAVNKRQLEFLRALVALDGLGNGKVPFHK
jgi:hypothetical protein